MRLKVYRTYVRMLALDFPVQKYLGLASSFQLLEDLHIFA